eukprot:282108_1
MTDFEELCQQNERTYTSNSEELLSIVPAIPQITQNERGDYQQRGQICLRNMERAIANLAQALRRNRSMTSSQKDQYRQQLNVSKQQCKSQRSDLKIALQKQRFNNNKFETEKKETI